MHEQPIRHFFTDIDNTFDGDWVKMHAEGMKAMTEGLVDSTGFPYEEVRNSIREVYKGAKTMEFPPLIQSMDIYKDLDKDELLDLIMMSQNIYDEVRERVWTINPELLEFFYMLKMEGVNIHVLTDAPMLSALKRVEIADMFEMANTIAAYRDVMQDIMPHTYKQKMARVNREHPDTKIIELQDHKPNHDVGKIFGISQVDIETASGLLDDSSRKGMQQVKNSNMRWGFFVRYGRPSDQDWEALMDFSPRPSHAEAPTDEVLTENGKYNILSIHRPSDLERILFSPK